jgi:pimeloyl-ACP methyl ester carboxylesterase
MSRSDQTRDALPASGHGGIGTIRPLSPDPGGLSARDINTPGGVRIAYESIGDNERGVPMLLIQGLGAPMLGWRREFCEAVAAQGFRVIRFDNRDCGLSL